MSVPISQFIPPFPHPCSHIHFLHLSLFLPCKYVQFFYVPHICINMWYFSLTSFFVTISKSIHISTNDPVSFFFYDQIIFHCVCVCVCVCVYIWWWCLVTKSCLTLATSWTHQIPLSMWFFRQEYWSGLPFPFPDPGIKPVFPTLTSGFFTTEPLIYIYIYTHHIFLNPFIC